MRKQELIHLHGLLLEVRGDCAREADLSAYDALGIGPSSIHRRKDDHRAAVFALVEAITDDVCPERSAVDRTTSA